MKQSLLFLITLCIQSFGFADFQTPRICYSADQSISEYVPQTFCFESISYDQKNTIIIKGANLDGIFPITNKELDREDRLSLTTIQNFVDVVEPDCSHAEQADLILTAFVEQNMIDPSQLKIQVRYAATMEDCHSAPMTKLIDYRYHQP